MQAAPLFFRKVRARVGRLWRHDDGSSSVEWVALTAGIAALMVAVAMALQSQGTRIGTSIGQVIQCHIVAVGNGASCGNGVPAGLSIGGAISPSVGNVGTVAAGFPLMLEALPIPPAVALVLGLAGLLLIGGLAAAMVVASNIKIASDSVVQKVTGAHTTVAAVEPKRVRIFVGGSAVNVLLAQGPDIRQVQTPTPTLTPTPPGQSPVGYAANVGNRMTGAIGVGASEVVTQQEPNVNVRAGPGVDTGVVTVVHPGDEVEILESGTTPWVRVRVRATGQIGWMDIRYARPR